MRKCANNSCENESCRPSGRDRVGQLCRPCNAKRRARQAHSRAQPKCSCGNCLPLGVTKCRGCISTQEQRLDQLRYDLMKINSQSSPIACPLYDEISSTADQVLAKFHFNNGKVAVPAGAGPASESPDPHAANVAIRFALKADQGLDFLRCWSDQDFDSIRLFWPEAPEDIYPSAK